MASAWEKIQIRKVQSDLKLKLVLKTTYKKERGHEISNFKL